MWAEVENVSNTTLLTKKPKICVISATPITIHFFFTEHIERMAGWADVHIVYNNRYHPDVQPLGVPATTHHLAMHRSISPVADVVAFCSLLSLFRREKFDFVVTLVPKAGLLGMIAAWCFGIGTRLHIFQGEVWASKTGIRRFILKGADKITAACSSHLLAVSLSERMFLISQNIVSPEKINVLGDGSISGVNPDRFKPNKTERYAMRDELKIPQAATIILFVGRLARDKGLFELFQSFNELCRTQNDLFLLIVGPDDDGIVGDLKSNVTCEHQEHVRFVGLTDEAEKFMATADIFCLPSYREGFGLAALEASACELPVVGTDIHGLRDAVSHKETGLLVPPGEVAALTESLSCLIQDKSMMAELGSKGRQRAVDKFSSLLIIEAYDHYFRNVYIPD